MLQSPPGMARKDRVPNPPKRPQAPQRRHTPTDPAVAARRRRNVLIALGGAALVAIAIALGAILLSSSDADAAQALEDAGCTQQTFPGQPGTHVQSLTATPKPKWNSSPPTSGPHYFTPAIWEFYSEPVPLIQSVHNLEHGGIVIHYGADVTQETLTQLRSWYDESPNGILVSPLAVAHPEEHDRAVRLDGRAERGRERISCQVHQLRRGCVLRFPRRASLQRSRAVPVRSAPARPMSRLD